MNLLVNQLKNAIRELLTAKGVKGRVLDKVNERGEIVIAAIIDRELPSASAPSKE